MNLIIYFLKKGSFGLIRGGLETDTIFTFDYNDMQLNRLSIPRSNKTDFAIVARANEIVICGGYQDGQATAPCFHFNVHDDR